MAAYSHSESKSSSLSSSELLARKSKRMTLEIHPALHSLLKKASASEDVFIRDIMVEAAERWLKERGY